MSTISLSNTNLKNMVNKYKILPKNSMEFGGVMCGNKVYDNFIIRKFVDIPSTLGRKDSYYFNKNIMKSSLCSPYKPIGLWHTHPTYSPFPSDVDRQTTSKLNIIGCVVTDSLRCFEGEKNLILQIN